MRKVLGMVMLLILASIVLVAAQPPVTPEVVIGGVKEASKWLEPENLKIMFSILVTIITLASPFLLKGWHALIVLAQKKSNNQLISQYLGRVDVAMPSIVKAVYTEFVKDAKKKASDGKLTQEEIKEASNMAYARAKKILGPAGVAMLSKSGIDLQTYVEGLSGVHVEHAKNMFKKLTEEDSKN